MTSSSEERSLDDDNDDDDGEEGLSFELFNFQNEYIPSKFVSHVVRYISGYIVHRFKSSRSTNSCADCFDFIVGHEGSSVFTDLRNRGDLSYASEAVVKFCFALEGYVRDHPVEILDPKFTKKLVKNIVDERKTFFIHSHFDEFDDHAEILCKYMAKLYVTVRIHHEDRISNRLEKYIRRINTKIILFKNQ